VIAPSRTAALALFRCSHHDAAFGCAVARSRCADPSSNPGDAGMTQIDPADRPKILLFDRSAE
jgi:hypothetical protein